MDNSIVGIIGAMDVEVDTLIGQLDTEQVSTTSGMDFHRGRLAGHDVVIVRCGIGKVNATMCAQTLIDRYGATVVINTGVAGALDTSLDIGDLVVSTDAVHHDMDVTGLGHKPGRVPDMDTLAFVASKKLSDIMCKAAAEVAPDITVRRGRVASGDQFVSTKELKNRIVDLFGALCCEMEGAAIAHVCYRNEVPFVIVRAISDKADETSTVEYRFNEQEIAEHCAAIVSHALTMLP